METDSDLDQVRALFRDYAGSLEVDLALQGFDAELATLPGKYAPPRGTILLARDEKGTVLGCIGLRPLDRPGACEIKRLYVRLEGRGTGAGRSLARAVIGFAATAGYREILLDTLPQMDAAIRLYRALGFAEIPPYWNSPLPGTLYFGKALPTR
ncbi:GNAT family N-acetyltransferase [uncultured Enterovirga sp.]|uniref:GNAT family N-acetyltransferase n=1 Tax=uncultured Enterovirga sp. TaxID=2026352 RepID=UPI0035CC8936